MKQFFKFTLASLVGVLIAGLLLIFIFTAIIGGMISGISSSKVEQISANTVLRIKLDQPINDMGGFRAPTMWNPSFFKEEPGLVDILENIKKAKGDDNIKGIYITSDDPYGGWATMHEIREAIIDFKSSGKFVVAYADNYSQKGYYFASVADEIYLNPQGSILLKGLNMNIMFFKNLLDKLNVEAQIIRHGEFKSAVEPFILDRMSKANKEQNIRFIQSIWDEVVASISTSRKISKELINSVSDSLLTQNAEIAKSKKFVDDLIYEDQVFVLIKEKMGKKATDKITFIDLASYIDVPDPNRPKSAPKNNIAVIFAEGNIVDGKGMPEQIGSETMSNLIRKARKDSKVDAIVLRVNSPGGSALASDVIWREVKLARETKPVVVSIGDVAASGGYYISCIADSVFASGMSVTGSIGVFGMIPNIKGLVTDKLGITFDEVRTNKNAGFISIYRPFSSYERDVLQNSVERVYGTFIDRVASGRSLTTAYVDGIGQGRVWSGADAKEIKLIDKFGGLNRAILSAARMAGIEGEDYQILKYPQKKEPLQALLDEFAKKKGTETVRSAVGPFYEHYNTIMEFMEMKGVQARLPFSFYID